MSQEPRYHHLNQQIMKLKNGRSSHVKIHGAEKIDIRHQDVMLEAAATSLQIHLQVEPENIVRYYNSSILASSVMVGLTANTLCFWQETLGRKPYSFV